MKKVIGIISLLLSVTLATANPIDFDKAFKESANIEKQIKRTSFPDRTYLITDFGAKPDTPDMFTCTENVLAMASLKPYTMGMVG
jgi:hypothetical protein